MTGRKQLAIGSEKKLIEQCKAEYLQMVNDFTVSTDIQGQLGVQYVSYKIIDAAKRYYEANGWTDKLKYFDWEVNLLVNEAPNAVCYPGGKIAVFDGILPVVRDEDGLATIIGHEVAHALAGHSLEKKAHAGALNLGATVLDVAFVVGGKSVQTRQLAQAGYGLAAKYGIFLPYNRSQELEADEMGLYLMAMAGFDPSKAPEVWQRMTDMYGNRGGFYTTHPKNKRRIASLEAHLNDAIAFAEKYPDKDKIPTLHPVEEPVLAQVPPSSFQPEAPLPPSRTTLQKADNNLDNNTALNFSSMPQETAKQSSNEKSKSNEFDFRVEIARINQSEYRSPRFSSPAIKGKTELKAVNGKDYSVLITKSFANQADALTELRRMKGYGFQESAIVVFKYGKFYDRIIVNE